MKQTNDYLTSRYELEKKFKSSLFQDIINFDWNLENEGTITLQESLMNTITNDLGCNSPHTTHIMFSEFLKFMFLNAVKFQKEKITGKLNYTKIDINESTVNAYQGLCPPPYLDIIWAHLYSTKAYSRFCRNNFSGFLLRCWYEDEETNYLNYQVTLNLLSENEDMIHPYPALWPSLTQEAMVKDSHGFVSIQSSRLKKILMDIDNEIKERIFINHENICYIANKIFEDHTLKYSAPEVITATSQNAVIKLKNDSLVNLKTFTEMVMK